ncbi:MAG: hypothetical protein IJ727_09525, partial [Treponema sp.]|nr:hypothetical protein [Treponema sp.]
TGELFQQNSLYENISLPEEFRRTDEELEELNSLTDFIADEIMHCGLNYDEIKRYGRYLARTEPITKKDYCAKLARALCNPLRFFLYYGRFSDESKEIFVKMSYYTSIERSEIISACFGNNHGFSFFNDCHSLPLSFLVNYSMSEIITLGKNVKRCLQIHFSKIRQVYLEDNIDFEKSRGYFSEEEGREFLLNMPQILQVLSDSAFFERDTAAPILKGTYSKILKIVQLTEFTKDADLTPKKLHLLGMNDANISYPKINLDELQNARSTLALAFLSLTVKSLTVTKSGKAEYTKLLMEPHNLLRKLLTVFFNVPDWELDKKFFFPFLSFRYFYDGEMQNYRVENFPKIFSLIKENLPEEPVAFSSFVSLLERKNMPRFFSSRCDVDMRYTSCEESAYYDSYYMSKYKIFINNDEYYNAFVLEQSLTALFLMLSSLGLFEIIWNKPIEKIEKRSDLAKFENNLNMYRFGRIAYIKVTSLGKYVFGLTENFNIENIKRFSPPVLDSSSLIIHIEEGDKSMQLFLEPFCLQLSRTLFKADEGKLKKYCATPESVNMVFSTLSSRSEEKLPSVWKKLKDDILEIFVSMPAVTDWLVFSIDKSNAAFIREAEKLCRLGLCLKMEGSRIAVKKEKYASFKKKLEAAGFKFLKD